MATTFSKGQQLTGKLGIYTIVRQLRSLPNIWLATNTLRDLVVVKTDSRQSRLDNEADFLKELRGYPTIRQLVDEVETGPGLILEYLDTDLLHLSWQRPLKRWEIKTVAESVLEALTEIHSMGDGGIVHTDIKPNNILVSTNDHGLTGVKLADFGTAVRPGLLATTAGQFISNRLFRRPEAFLEVQWGPPTDVWSLGAILAGLMIGPGVDTFAPARGTPEDQRDMAALRKIDEFFGPLAPRLVISAGEQWTRWCIANILSRDERSPFRNFDPEEIAVEDVDFVCSIMKIDPVERPTATALLEHKWFKTED